MSETMFLQAQSVEKISIVILLTECGLSIREMNSPRTKFLVAKQDGKIVGCIGLENCGQAGLLHSLAVKRDFRGIGLGRQLYEKISEQSLDEGIGEFYVLTRAAEGLFTKWGFETIDREQAPAEISDTNDFKNDIFSTYTCMKKKLERRQEAAAPAAAAPAQPGTAVSPVQPQIEEKAAVKDEPPVAVIPAAVETPAAAVTEPAAAPAVAAVPAAGEVRQDAAAPVSVPQVTVASTPDPVASADEPSTAAASAAAEGSTDKVTAPGSVPPAAPETLLNIVVPAETPAAAAAPAEAEGGQQDVEPAATIEPASMQEALQELNDLPEEASKAAAPAAAVEEAATLIVPPEATLSVPADATLMKTSESSAAAVSASPAATPAPAPVQKTAAAVDVKYFPAGRLPLLDDTPGARAWGVSLSGTALKYYEMAPKTIMEAHTHGYEHITMVVEGQLFFGIADEVIGVRSGEMIAVPANTPHSVFTNDQPAKAFEAVSVVPEKDGK